VKLPSTAKKEVTEENAKPAPCIIVQVSWLIEQIHVHWESNQKKQEDLFVLVLPLKCVQCIPYHAYANLIHSAK